MAGYTSKFAHDEMSKTVNGKKPKLTKGSTAARLEKKVAAKNAPKVGGKTKVRVKNAMGGGYHEELR